MSLTRGGIALVGLILFVAVLSTPTNATIFIVISCLIALLLLNVPYAFFAVRGLSVHREHPSHVKEGTEMRVRLHIANRSGSGRILLRFFDKGPGGIRSEAVQIPLLPKGRNETVSYTCNAGKRGVYQFKTCRIESSSPFGLVNARRRVRAESELVVYPLYYEFMGAMFPFSKSYTGMTAAPGSRPGEGSSFFGLREYREGDPIRKIHWPSTARAQTLMVKEFEEDIHSSIVLLLDTYRPSVISAGGDTNLETAIRAVASLANYTLVNGHPTTLIYFDRTAKCLRSDRAMGDLTPILDSLARLCPSAMKPSELISAGGDSAPRHSNWIVVLLSPDQAAMEGLLKVRTHGTEVMLVIVDKYGSRPRETDRTWFPAMMDMFEAAGINTIMIAPGDDIQANLSRNLRSPIRVRV